MGKMLAAVLGLAVAACAERAEVITAQYRDLNGYGARSHVQMQADEAACRFEINRTLQGATPNSVMLSDCMLARKWQTVGQQAGSAKIGFGL